MRILLVEDEQTLASFLKKQLLDKCFTVDVASDGEKGFFLARTTDYDLVILDNLLPKMNGKEVCEGMRSRGMRVPILMLSVRADSETKAELLNAGADDYLGKPFSFDELLARIGALLRRPPTIVSATLKVGDIELDALTFTVRRAKKEIYLTRKEFTLLQYLMRNKNVVLSRGMLLEHVWDMDTDPFSNTVEAHIASLRRKIATGGRKQFIKTITGRGYMLAA